MSGIPFAATRWDEIVPGLYQGGHDYDPGDGVRDVVVTDEFDLVVSLHTRWGDYGPAEGVRHLTYRIPDGQLAPRQLERIRDLAHEVWMFVTAGQKVFVRCQAGYNRSGLVVALVLMEMGHTADEAIALVREKRSSWALFNENFLEYLRADQAVSR